MALLVANVPALTGALPSHGPLGAFFALWIPFIGLKRPYSIVKQVDDPARRRGARPASW